MKTLKLEKQENSKKSSHALAGANIRKELKHKFPATKFSVTTETFSGGTSLDVIWTDGATEAEIQAITNKYEYGSFNGMEDIYEYDKNHDGSYGDVKYLHTKRHCSKEAMQEVLKEIDKNNIEIKVSDYDGHAFIQEDEYTESEVYRKFRNKSFYTTPTTTQTASTANNAPNEEIFKASTLEDFTHTKTQEVLKVLKVAGTLTKEAFNSFRNYMKQEQGAYYSRYAKGFVLSN